MTRDEKIKRLIDAYVWGYETGGQEQARQFAIFEVESLGMETDLETVDLLREAEAEFRKSLEE